MQPLCLKYTDCSLLNDCKTLQINNQFVQIRGRHGAYGNSRNFFTKKRLWEGKNKVFIYSYRCTIIRLYSKEATYKSGLSMCIHYKTAFSAHFYLIFCLLWPFFFLYSAVSLKHLKIQFGTTAFREIALKHMVWPAQKGRNKNSAKKWKL